MLEPITDEFIDLVTRAHDYLTQKQDRLRAEFRLNDHERWDWDQDAGTIVFSSKGRQQVVADIRCVGSTSEQTGTWLWAWANEHLNAELCEDIKEVREYGKAHSLVQLTTPKWKADAVDGWEMTSISAYVLQAEGAYRTPRDEGGFTYLLLDNVRWVENAA